MDEPRKVSKFEADAVIRNKDGSLSVTGKATFEPPIPELNFFQRKRLEIMEGKTPQQLADMTPDNSLADGIAAGDFTIAETWKACEPKPNSPTPETTSFDIIEVLAGNELLGEHLPEEAGLKCWRTGFHSVPLQHAKEILAPLYLEHEITVRFSRRRNEDELRRRDAAAKAPNIIAGFPKTKQDLDELQVVEWNQRAMATCRKWLHDVAGNVRAGRGLSLRSRVTGCGKTTLLCATALEAVRESGQHARYIFVPKLIQMDFADIKTEMEIAEKTGILILDDIDAAVKPAASPHDLDSSRSRQLILRLVNERYNARLPIFWTSNTRTSAEFLYNLGDRIIRRITERNTKLEFGDEAWDWATKIENESKRNL